MGGVQGSGKGEERERRESNVTKPGKMSVDDLFKKESLLTKFHILPSL